MVKLLIQMINLMCLQSQTLIELSNVPNKFLMISTKYRKTMQLILAFSKLVWIRSIKMKSKELFKSHQGTLSIIKHKNKSIGKLSRK